MAKQAPIVARPPDPEPPLDWREVRRALQFEGSIAGAARSLGVGRRAIRSQMASAGLHLPAAQHVEDVATRPMYVTWRTLIRRCTDPSYVGYARYGGRGVRVCRAWQEFSNFRAWALRAGWRRGHCLVSVAVARGYSPSNCRWVSRSEMLRLRGRSVSLAKVMIVAWGEQKSAAEWARDRRCRMSYIGLLSRLRRGWPAEAAIASMPRAPCPLEIVEPVPLAGKRGPALDWKRVVRMHVDQGLDVRAIATALRCSTSTIYAGLAVRRVRGRVRARLVESDFDVRLYSSWSKMRRRYAKRCGWPDFVTFRDWAKRAGYRKGLCLVRLDRTQPHGPANCRFVSPALTLAYAGIGSEPTRQPHYRLRALGEAKGPTEWARDPRCQVALSTLMRRLNAGWTAEDAITTEPLNPGRRGQYSRPISAFGQTKGAHDWARDPRCTVTAEGLRDRLAAGMDPESAMTLPLRSEGVWKVVAQRTRAPLGAAPARR